MSETVELAAKQPFDLRKSLRAMAYFRPAVGEQIVTGESVRKGLAVRRGGKDKAVVVDVSPSAAGVEVALHGAKDTEREGVLRAVADWLSLDDDPTPFLRIAEKDPPMADILRVTRGLHQGRFASLAEGVCYFLLTHRTSQAVAAGRKRRLAEAYGPRLEVDGVEHVAFPTLEALAGVPVSDLRAYAANDQQAERLAAAIAGVTDLGGRGCGRRRPTRCTRRCCGSTVSASSPPAGSACGCSAARSRRQWGCGSSPTRSRPSTQASAPSMTLSAPMAGSWASGAMSAVRASVGWRPRRHETAPAAFSRSPTGLAQLSGFSR